MSYNSYQPNGYPERLTHLDHLPPPPPPPGMPPMPPARVFRGSMVDSYRPDGAPYASYGHAQHNEFSFRNNSQAPQYPRQEERDRSENDRRPFHRNNPSNRGRGRGRGTRIVTAERPLLRLHQGEETQQVLGSAGNTKAAQKFQSMGNLTDSGDESMEESDPDNETVLQSTQTEDGVNGDVSARPTKRRAIARTDEASEAPKWSNPDPYTVLPPVDEEQRKRKDVVKLIRKARIVTEKEQAAQNEVAANDDFISFGNEDKSSDEDEEDQNTTAASAPNGPRQPNPPQYVQNLQTNGAPGTNTVPPSASQLGPPPALNSTINPSPRHLVHNLSADSGNAETKRVARIGNDTKDVNLGSRKRTHDDEIKPVLRRPPPPKKGKGPPSNGSLVDEWVPRHDQNPTPWLIRSQYRTENAGFRLHKEICDFYDFVKPQQFEQTVREDLLQRLQSAVRHEYPDCDVHCFGSFAAGLYLPNADMDVVVISQSFRNYGEKSVCQSKKRMYKFSYYLERTVAEKGSVECITGAKVPIIKLVDRTTAIRVDMSFENDTGIIANDTFSVWKRQFPAMPILVTIVKQFLMMRDLNDVATGGLGGFSVTCLVTSLLQNMPRVRLGELVPEHHLGEILIEFLDFYGNQLDISRTGITMSPPGYFDKIAASRSREVYQADRSNRLAIIDPNKPENDISGGSRNVSLILDRFARAHEEIMIAMKSTNRLSLLDWMLGGNYENFTWQREHLRDLYVRRWGPVKAQQLIQRPTRSGYVLEQASHTQITHLGNSFENATAPIQESRSKEAPVISMQYRDPKTQSTHVKSSKSKEPGPTNIKGRNRAQRLREMYPSIKNIPESVSAKLNKTLIEQYDKETGRQSKPQSPKATKSKRKTRISKHGGLSKNDPITID